MQHLINSYAIEEHANVLKQLCCSSLEYLRQIEQNPSSLNHSSEIEIEKDDYFNWLEYTVSNNLIEMSTKIRILLDNLKLPGDLPYSPEVEAYYEFNDTLVSINGCVKGSLRECCNKTIHATSFELFNKCTNDGISYWSGIIILSGKQYKNEWKVGLNVFNFCRSIKSFLSILKNI